MWNYETRETATNLAIDRYFKERDFESYDVHMAIVSKSAPSYYAYAQHIGQVCSKSTTILAVNNQNFRAMLSSYITMQIHELDHVNGGIHADGKDYEPKKLEEQINNCLNQ
jgi:hypothetical protein